jgi:hypothetical protein
MLRRGKNGRSARTAGNSANPLALIGKGQHRRLRQPPRPHPPKSLTFLNIPKHALAGL